MKKILLALSLLPFGAICQKPMDYTVSGSSAPGFFHNKEVIVSPAVFTGLGNEYNDSDIKIVTLQPNNGNFILKGYIRYPTPVQFSYLSEGRARLSDFLFLEAGNLQVHLADFNINRELGANMHSTANNEYSRLKSLYRHLEVDNGSTRIVEGENIEKKDSILEAYTKQHNNSYVAMWVLIYDYLRYKYSDRKYAISKLFSPGIQNTDAFKLFAERINTERLVAIGKIFPFDILSFGKTIRKTVEASGYTLIDFWSTLCKPCIAQFPYLQKIYAAYKVNGFEIYSVAIDRKTDINNIDPFLKEKEIKWKNIIDIDRAQSRKIGVNGIPRNFLLDSGGVILAADISPEDLELYIKEKLNE